MVQITGNTDRIRAGEECDKVGKAENHGQQMHHAILLFHVAADFFQRRQRPLWRLQRLLTCSVWPLESSRDCCEVVMSLLDSYRGR